MKSAKLRKATRNIGAVAFRRLLGASSSFAPDKFELFQECRETKRFLQEDGVGWELRFRKIVGIA